MRRFTIPASIRLRDRVTGTDGELVAFNRIANRWINTKGIANDMSEMRRWMKVADAILDREPGAVVTLEDQDHETLLEALDKDIPLDPPGVAMQLMPFYDAVTNAEEVKDSG